MLSKISLIGPFGLILLLILLFMRKLLNFLFLVVNNFLSFLSNILFKVAFFGIIYYSLKSINQKLYYFKSLILHFKNKPLLILLIYPIINNYMLNHTKLRLIFNKQ